MRLLLIIIIYMFTFLTTVYADVSPSQKFDISFYGQIDMSFFYKHNNDKNSGFQDTDRFSLHLVETETLFGAEFNYEKLSGVLELQPVNSIDIFKRYFATYNFLDDLSLTVGKDWTLAGYSEYFTQYSDDYNALWRYGTLIEQRLPQLRLTWKNLSFAVIWADDPEFDMDDYSESIFQLTNYIPRFELAYRYESDDFIYKIYAGYAGYNMNIKESLSWDSYSSAYLQSFYVGAGAMYDFGRVYISMNVFMGTNLAIWGGMADKNWDTESYLPKYIDTSDSFTYVGTLGIATSIGIRIIDILELTFGGGYTTSSHDSITLNGGPIQFSAYINLPITIGENFYVIPEIAYYEQTADQFKRYTGSDFFAGVYTVIYF